MDTHTLELLDFDKVRALVAARAACSLGKAAAQRIEPSVDPGEIHGRQALTTEMAEALGSGLRPPFGGLHDIRHLARRAQKGSVLEAEELAETVETLRAIGNLDVWLARVGDQFPRLGGLRQEVGEFSGLAVAIEGCLDSRGKVLDTASRRLSRPAARDRPGAGTNPGNAEADAPLARDPADSPLPQFHNGRAPLRLAGGQGPSRRGAGLRAPHQRQQRDRLHRADRHRRAIGPAFVPPAREAKEVRRILRWLSAQVGMVAESLLGTLDTMAELDLIHARARLSIDYRMSAPHFNQEGRLVLRAARHPLLEALFRSDPAIVAPPSRPAATAAEPIAAASTDAEPQPSPADLSEPSRSPTRRTAPPHPSPRTVTPIDVNLGLRFRILVVTGPNTGGKTVALKTVGLLAIMAQSGLHVPAGEGSQFPIFDDVLTDIGDEQSLEQSLSTFSSHVGRIREILGKATSRSLVLLDELGAGTDPTDGAALGRAILDELDRIGCRAIVTTHIGDLKTYALSNPGAENAAVEFDDETFRPKYRLHDRRHRPVERAQDRAAVAAARARGRAGGGLPGPEPERRSARLGSSPAAAQGGRGGPRGGDRGPGRSRADARSSRASAWPNCKRSRRRPTRSPRPALAFSRATAWLSRGSATTAPAGWSSSTRARRPPSSRSGMSPGTSRSTS